MSVKIDPDTGHTPQELAKLEAFGKSISTRTPFETIIAEATKLITPGDQFRLANDILIVTYCGPQRPFLTVMDLPGLVTNRNADQDEDAIRGIDAMADRYLRSPRTIILTVVGGNTDLALAHGPVKARLFDPTGARTMGVLTKPDLCKFSGHESLYMRVLAGEDPEHQYGFGWHAVLNPGPGENEQSQFWSDAERHQAEKSFFSQGPWNALNPDFVGALALRKALSKNLAQHIAKYIPQLREELRADYNKSAADLEALGPGSDKPEDMRKELIRLADKSKDLITSAVNGKYSNPDYRDFFPLGIHPGGTPSTKLRALTVERNNHFAELIEKQGRRVELKPSAKGSGPTRALDLLNVAWDAPRSKLPSITEEEFAKVFVAELIRQNTGTEPCGDYKPDLIYDLFQWYSKDWNVHALRHQEAVGDLCDRFLNSVIQHDWPKHYQAKLRKTLVDREVKKLLESARAEVKLLDDSRRFDVGPYNAEYREKHKEWMKNRKSDEWTPAFELLQKMIIYYRVSLLVTLECALY
jgi:hypothetical protein